MRFGRLDLLRYGRFTDARIDLPARSVDLHIILGPNEAGKSTTLSAIESLLFGIARNSPYDFVHSYDSMRIGAVLQQGQETTEIRRRKGNKNTLLAADESVLSDGERVLSEYLGGVDQTFFTRMFCLDHERLREGGREILEAKDEVGQILFSASTGLSGLRDKLKALQSEADTLWAPRKASHRQYYQAADRLDAAEKAIREHTVTASKWQEIKRAFDAVQDEYRELELSLEAVTAEQRKLSRIRRVHRSIGELASLDLRIRDLGETADLPPDALGELEAAERSHDNAAARMETLNERLAAEQKERAALQCDEALLLREEEIQQFHKRRIEVQKEKADLPNRLAELAAAQAHLQRLAESLAWESRDTDSLIAKIPSRPMVGRARGLLNERGERLSTLQNAQLTVADAEAHIAELTREISGLGPHVDVSTLAAVLQAARNGGDLKSQLSVAENDLLETSAMMHRGLQSLHPRVAGAEVLVSMPAPPREAVLSHRDAVRAADKKLEDCVEQIRQAELQWERLRKTRERLTHDEDAVAPDEIAEARATRDMQWQWIRRRYVDEGSSDIVDPLESASVPADLPGVYENAVALADRLADRRSLNAEAAAQLVMVSRQIAEQQELLDVLRQHQVLLSDGRQALEAAWLRMWQDAPFAPLAPDAMLEWLSSRDEILQASERHARAQRQVAALQRQESELKALVLDALTRVQANAGALTEQPFRVVLEAAVNLFQRCEQEAVSRRQLEERLHKAETELARKRRTLQMAGDAWSEWLDNWAVVAQALGIRPETEPGVAAGQLDTLDQLREASEKIQHLRLERIGKIERDIYTFSQDVADFVASLPEALSSSDANEGVLQLERALEVAKGIKEQQKNKDQAIRTLSDEIEKTGLSAQEAHRAIRQLHRIAGTQDINDLRTAIQNSDKHRALTADRSRMMDALRKEGDGLSLEQLADECVDVNIDQAAARELTLEQELRDLRSRLVLTTERRAQARHALDAIGGDSRVAESAAAREAALAEVRDVASRYVRVKTATTLLQWAIDRYRKEKQAPLLKRAGSLFATLTSGSFVDLRVEFDEQDHAQLAGLRNSGESVRVSGLSTGTADQLYLALRVAAVEDYLTRASALPFVTDDLFINFDDNRAAAGLQVLAQLATRTQVLFFTHHRHLVDIARRSLGDALSVIELQATTKTLVANS